MSMATHIGVLQNGKLVQFGSPREIYKNPLSQYVAERLGSPRINVLPADLFGDAPTGAVTIGLRTEHIVQGSGVGGRVNRVEHLGDHTRLHMSLAGHDLIVVMDPQNPVSHGDTLAISPLDPIYFDADGIRIQ
jgi:multiple sugar transport system ATP-binding protein